MVVELVGLPGVGKSFICRSLQKVYTDGEDARVRIVVETQMTALGALHALLGKLWRASRFAVTHGGTTGRIVRALRASGPVLRRGRPSKLVNLLFEMDRSACVEPLQTLICEQGVLQAIWSLEMRSDEPVHADLLAALSRWLPERVVFVGTEREEYESRLRQREGGRSHFDRLDDDRLPEAIERGQRRMHEILDVWARQVRGADRLNFRNDRNARVDDIVEWVSRFRPAPPSAATA